jgi:hypothetical protein
VSVKRGVAGQKEAVERATMVTLHVPSEQLPELLQRLDNWIVPLCSEHPGFLRMFCLESSDGPNRSRLLIVSLWEGADFREAEAFADRLWDDISQVLGVGIARQNYTILRDVLPVAP